MDGSPTSKQRHMTIYIIIWQLANLSRCSQNIKVGMATVIKLLLFFLILTGSKKMRRTCTVKRKQSLGKFNRKRKEEVLTILYFHWAAVLLLLNY